MVVERVRSMLVSVARTGRGFLVVFKAVRLVVYRELRVAGVFGCEYGGVSRMGAQGLYVW